ncbi:MAG: hypothetical protein JWN41_1295 [Thermoleophilia bacterium]|nr:hypothetical protein [Thermoleophilia bacterium]
MGHAAISLDRFRRTRITAPEGELSASAESGEHPLVGASLGVIERTFGLMKSEQLVSVVEVVAASGDLAIADRLAFVASFERHVPTVVVLYDGWFVACITDVPLDAAAFAQFHQPLAGQAAPRIMSIVSDRGITPALGPLACA